MKKKRALLLPLLALALGFCVLIARPARSIADFGDFSGDGDYGGDSSWDSGSSWDDGSSWDSGSSWDDDDDSYTAGTYGAYDGGGSGDGGSGGGMFSTIIGLLIVAAVLYFVYRRSRAKQQTQNPGAVRTGSDRLTPIAQYASLDPAFSEAAMQEKLSNLYVQMQHGWQDKNIESVRPYFTDALYAQMDRQLNAYRTGRRTNYVERIAVLGVTLRGYYQSGGDDHIVAELRTRIVDYTLSDATGALVSGNRTAEKFMTYEWDLCRPSGRTTAAEGEVQNIHCPSCGAPLSINASAKCPYCDSVVTLKDHDFVIYAIRGIAQRTNS